MGKLYVIIVGARGRFIFVFVIKTCKVFGRGVKRRSFLMFTKLEKTFIRVLMSNAVIFIKIES
jgi:hypothetical protein